MVMAQEVMTIVSHSKLLKNTTPASVSPTVPALEIPVHVRATHPVHARVTHRVHVRATPAIIAHACTWGVPPTGDQQRINTKVIVIYIPEFHKHITKYAKKKSSVTEQYL